ncbi:MAG: hypothetical protein H7Y38_13415 [Armatimonadetes bacterium]|nr:hypothetical protein [Armatimonadota bacterium]
MRTNLFFVLLAALTVGAGFAAQSALSQQPDKSVVLQTVSTIGGDLTIRHSGKRGSDFTGQVWSVFLGKKRIGIIKEVMDVHVYSYNSQYAFGDTVVLSTAQGGNACPALFRVVHIKEDGKVTLTEEFGDCSDIPTVMADGKGLRMTFPGFYPNYRAQEPGFKPPPPVTYVYQGGARVVERRAASKKK